MNCERLFVKSVMACCISVAIASESFLCRMDFERAELGSGKKAMLAPYIKDLVLLLVRGVSMFILYHIY